MPKCVIKRCRNNTVKRTKKDGVTYHRFPHHELRKEEWRKLVAKERREESYKPNDSSVICSKHFLESDMYYTDKGYKRLKRTALPQLTFDEVPEPILENRQINKEVLESRPMMFTVEVKQEKYDEIPPTSDSNLDRTGFDSESDTVQTAFYKKELKNLQSKLDFKDRQVRNLKKQNQRLRKKNSFMKEIIKKLKKKSRLIDDSISSVSKNHTEEIDKSISERLST